MGDERDTFFEDALQCCADEARDPSPIVDDDGDDWFERAAHDGIDDTAAAVRGDDEACAVGEFGQSRRAI